MVKKRVINEIYLTTVIKLIVVQEAKEITRQRKVYQKDVRK